MKKLLNLNTFANLFFTVPPLAFMVFVFWIAV